MTGDLDLLDRLPDRLFAGLREQIVLGMLPSEDVEELIGPCLDDYESIFPRLPLPVRSDLESILRIYPEIAAKYGIAPGKTLLTVALDELWEKMKGKLRGRGASRSSVGLRERSELDEDIAAEPQRAFGPPREPPLFQGEAYLTTDRGHGIGIEYLYRGEEGRLLIRALDPARSVQVVLCGRIVATLGRAREEQAVDLERLIMLFDPDEIPDLEIEFREV